LCAHVLFPGACSISLRFSSGTNSIPSGLFQKRNYILCNPVVAGLAAKPEEYNYGSARNFARLEEPLEIIIESQHLMGY